MSLPKEVVICGIPHRVVLCDDNFNVDLHFGQINYEKAEIRINSKATDELQMQSLYHEMLHGMLVLIVRNEESSDESFVQCLSNALYQSFQLKRADSADEKVEINVFDEEEIYHNCTVQVLRNSITGETSVGWWKNSEDEE